MLLIKSLPRCAIFVKGNRLHSCLLPNPFNVTLYYFFLPESGCYFIKKVAVIHMPLECPCSSTDPPTPSPLPFVREYYRGINVGR